MAIQIGVAHVWDGKISSQEMGRGGESKWWESRERKK